MDEKTEELRDIFVSVTDEETATERQEDGHGSLLGGDEDIEAKLLAVIDRLRERFEVDTELHDEALVTIVQWFYDGEDDETIADALSISPATVFRARMELHLLREQDLAAPFDLNRLQNSEPADESIAAEFDLSPKAVARFRRAQAAKRRANQVSHRFQSQFEDVLQEAGMSTVMTSAVRDDGLGEATEDIGSLEEDADVDF